MAKAKKQPKKQLVPRTHNYKTFTESQYFGKIRGALRNAFRYWKPAMVALESVSRPSKSENKRLKKEYRCKKCKNWFPRKLVEIDHVVEAGSLRCYEDIVPFIKRLTVEDVKAYQILCKKCHQIKTKEYKDKKIKDDRV